MHGPGRRWAIQLDVAQGEPAAPAVMLDVAPVQREPRTGVATTMPIRHDATPGYATYLVRGGVEDQLPAADGERATAARVGVDEMRLTGTVAANERAVISERRTSAGSGGQAGDDADQPRVACRSATTEDQRSRTRGAHPPCGVDLRLILVGPRPRPRSHRWPALPGPDWWPCRRRTTPEAVR